MALAAEYECTAETSKSECSKAFLASEGRAGQGKAYAAVVAGATTRLDKSGYRKGCHEPDPGVMVSMSERGRGLYEEIGMKELCSESSA